MCHPRFDDFVEPAKHELTMMMEPAAYLDQVPPEALRPLNIPICFYIMHGINGIMWFLGFILLITNTCVGKGLTYLTVGTPVNLLLVVLTIFMNTRLRKRCWTILTPFLLVAAFECTTSSCDDEENDGIYCTLLDVDMDLSMLVTWLCYMAALLIRMREQHVDQWHI